MSNLIGLALPWGKREIIDNFGENDDIELLLIQQSCIDNMQQEIDILNAKLVVYSDRSVDRELEAFNANATIKELQEKSELSTYHHELQANEISSLKSEIVNLKAELDIANSTKRDVIKRNHDQERRLDAISYQKGVVQEQYDSLRAYNIELLSKFKSIESKNQEYEVYIGQIESTNRKLQSDVDGFPIRLKNSIAAELARHKSDQKLPTGHLLIDKADIERLQDQVRDLKCVKTSLGNEIQQLNSKISSLTKINDECKNSLTVADKLSQDAVAKMVEFESVVLHSDATLQALMIEHAKLTSEYELTKRDNLYLTQQLSYSELRTIYEDDDGTAVYIIGTNMKSALIVEDDENDEQSTDHPLCWVMNSNGTGHCVFLNKDCTTLLYPNQVEGTLCKFDKIHEEAIRNAIKDISIQKFNDALDRSVLRAQNVCYAADILDFDWSVPLQQHKIVEAIFEEGMKDRRLSELKVAVNQIKKLASLQKARVKKITKPIKKKK